MQRRTHQNWPWRLAHTGGILLCGVWLAVLTIVPFSEAQELALTSRAERSDIQGSLVIVGGGTIPEEIIERFLELGGGLNTRLVLITTASMVADSREIETRVLAYWHEQPVRSVDVLHTRNRSVADSPEFSRVLEEATAVWFIGGNQLNLTEVYQGTKTEERLHALVRRGGVIGGTSAGAAIMSRVMIGGNTANGPYLATGFGFLPGTIVDQHFLKRHRQPRLFQALEAHPGLVGIGIDEGTALIVRPQQVEVLGESEVELCLAGTKQRRQITQRFKSGDTIDLNKWSLAAVGRARFDSYVKADKRRAPEVPQGAVIVAGRKTPKVAVEEFLNAAGGKSAPVVLVTETDGDAEISAVESELQQCLAEIGAEKIQLCRASTAAELERPEMKRALAEARGVWFIGAQERRMMDFVLQARIDRLVKDVLERGGVVGGSSAGAKIHGDGMLCGDDDDADLLGDIYACGLGVLPGIVIEQQRVDTVSAASIAKAVRQRFPWCLGLGLQESAAVVVRGHTMHVLGDDAVAIIGEPGDDESNDAAIELVEAGQKYDLRARRRLSADAPAERSR